METFLQIHRRLGHYLQNTLQMIRYTHSDHHGINNSEIISHNLITLLCGAACWAAVLGLQLTCYPDTGQGAGAGLLAGWRGNGNLLFAAGFLNCTNCFVKVHYRALPGYSRLVTAPKPAQQRSCCTWNCEE